MRRGVNNHLAAVGNHQVIIVGDLADLRAGDIPVGANLRELFHIVRGDHGTHALLRLRGQDLGGRHILRTQRHHIQVHQHAAVTSCGEFRRRAGQSGAAKILDAHHNTSLVQVKAALNEHLLCKRISHLHCGQLAFSTLLKRVRGQHRHTADAVQTRAGTKKHHLIAQARGKRQFQVLHLQRAHAQRIDQWIPGVGFIKNGFTADVRQAQAVAITAHTINHTRQHTLGIRGVGRAETQLIHHRHWPCTHRHDVTHNAAHTRGGTLMRFHIRRVIMRLHAERHRMTIPNIDHTSVFTNTRQNLLIHLRGGGFTEITQMHFRRLIGAVLRPHHGIHSQFRVGGTTAKNILDPRVLVILQAQACIRLFRIRVCLSGGNSVIERSIHVSTIFPITIRQQTCQRRTKTAVGRP